MKTENMQCDSKTDQLPYDEPGLGSLSQPPDCQPVQEHQLGGYSYPPGYQFVPIGSLYNQQSNIPLRIPNKQQTGIPIKGTSQVIVTQPGQIIRVVVRPADYRCLSLVACLCCFWPTGLVAIYFASMANSMADNGQMKDAKIMSNCSGIFMIVSVVLGLIVFFCIMYRYGMLWTNGN